MTYQIHAGRCEQVLKVLADNSVDSIVTDPPYGLNFMGKKWDYQVPDTTQWAECLRVLKPGGHLLAFGGSRTYHRLVVNIEDAGFEIRDQLMWIYGSGFPKSKNLTGDYQGLGTALKPAHEPIVMARKPLSGTVEANVVEHGTGALNIDLCRIFTEEQLSGGAGGLMSHVRDGTKSDTERWEASTSGRWPSNIIHDGSPEVVDSFPDTKSGSKAVKRSSAKENAGNGGPSLGAESREDGTPMIFYGDSGSAARFFYCAKVSKADRDEGLERFIPVSANEMSGGRLEGSAGINNPRAGAGRTSGARNNHPTVKPTALMRYLCRLITPAGGIILDPFMGSGSTGKGAILEGYSFIGIDADVDSVTIAAARLAHALKATELEKREAA